MNCIDDLVKAARALESKGIQLSAGGCWDIDSDSLRTYLTDRGQWWADCHGISKEDMAEFEEYGGWPRCAATTKAGTRCKNAPADTPLGHGVEWFFTYHGEDYCRIHGGG